MAFCRFCGKEIADGSVCDCADAQAENAIPVTAEVTGSSDSAASKPSNKANIVLIAGLIVVLLIILSIVSAIAGGGYKKPAKDFIKAMNKSDGTLLAEIMFTDDILDDADDDDIDELSDALDSIKEYSEEAYGKNIKFSFDIEDKEKLSKKDVKEIEEFYKSEFRYDVKISKAYELTGTLQIKGKKEKSEDDITITVIKIKGDGWKLSAETFEDVIENVVYKLVFKALF